LNIAYSIPKEGSNLWFELLAIPPTPATMRLMTAPGAK